MNCIGPTARSHTRSPSQTTAIRVTDRGDAGPPVERDPDDVRRGLAVGDELRAAVAAVVRLDPPDAREHPPRDTALGPLQRDRPFGAQVGVERRQRDAQPRDLGARPRSTPRSRAAPRPRGRRSGSSTCSTAMQALVRRSHARARAEQPRPRLAAAAIFARTIAPRSAVEKSSPSCVTRSASMASSVCNSAAACHAVPPFEYTSAVRRRRSDSATLELGHRRTLHLVEHHDPLVDVDLARVQGRPARGSAR